MQAHIDFVIKNIKFILLLRKVVYPYEYMDNWERFNETSLPNKEDFYRSLNMEEITDVDYMHAKKVFKILIEILVIIMTYMFKVMHYYLLMYLKILEANVLKCMNLVMLIFYLHL